MSYTRKIQREDELRKKIRRDDLLHKKNPKGRFVMQKKYVKMIRNAKKIQREDELRKKIFKKGSLPVIQCGKKSNKKRNQTKKNFHQTNKIKIKIHRNLEKFLQ